MRVCRKLGLEGYRDLRIQIARELERARTQTLEIDPDRPFTENSSTADITSAIALFSKQALEASAARINTAAVRRAARLILTSRRVAYYALGEMRQYSSE